jgi:hypothetical protein
VHGALQAARENGASWSALRAPHVRGRPWSERGVPRENSAFRAVCGELP